MLFRSVSQSRYGGVGVGAVGDQRAQRARVVALEKSLDCGWPANDDLMRRYHDEEWGVPLHNDAALFEFILLDTFQAGLSWRTILHKRVNFRRAFDNFDVQKIALYKEEKIQELMLDVSIVRNQAKIRAAVTNAQHFIRIQEEFGALS